MFILTNEQRKYFGLSPVCDHWELIEAKASPFDHYKTFLYLDGNIIVKCILTGNKTYCEYEYAEKVSPDKKYLLPVPSRGKPVLLSSSNILKSKKIGMSLFFSENHIDLYNADTECSYFSNTYLNDKIEDIDEFANWVDKWCNNASDSDMAEIRSFSLQQRKHVRFQEGDVFRFRIARGLYGYGRILVDYANMRKKKEPFWDILMSKPLVCSVYHIVTERSDVSIDELKDLLSIPSTIIADNSLYCGEYEIIGNIPISDNEDYPIMYGNSISLGEKAVCYQCGKTYRSISNETALYDNFQNNGVSFKLNVKLDILLDCINENSNEPYWQNYYAYSVERDLRNPKHYEKLQEIKSQFGLN